MTFSKEKVSIRETFSIFDSFSKLIKRGGMKLESILFYSFDRWAIYERKYCEEARDDEDEEEARGPSGRRTAFD